MRRLYSDFIGGQGAVGLLILRVIAGGAMMLHGWPKVIHPKTGAFNMFTWMDRPGKPSPMPDVLQAMAALSEFGGGLALILGLLTPVAAFGILCTMAVATWRHYSGGDPWVSPPGAKGGSFESALGYLAVAAMFMLVGPGALSLDALIFNKSRHVSESRFSRARR